MSCSISARYQLEQYICELRVAIERAELGMCGHRRGTIVIPEKLRNEIAKLLDIITREIENGTKNGDTFDGLNVDHYLSRAKEIVTNCLNRGIRYRHYEWFRRFGPCTVSAFEPSVHDEWVQDQFESNLREQYEGRRNERMKKILLAAGRIPESKFESNLGEQYEDRRNERMKKILLAAGRLPESQLESNLGEQYEDRRSERVKKILLAAGRIPESEKESNEKLKPVEKEEQKERDSLSIEVGLVPDASGSQKDHFQFLFQETTRQCLRKTPHTGIIAIVIITTAFIFAVRYCL